MTTPPVILGSVDGIPVVPVSVRPWRNHHGLAPRDLARTAAGRTPTAEVVPIKTLGPSRAIGLRIAGAAR